MTLHAAESFALACALAYGASTALTSAVDALTEPGLPPPSWYFRFLLALLSGVALAVLAFVAVETAVQGLVL